jgi:hypothetical protein
MPPAVRPLRPDAGLPGDDADEERVRGGVPAQLGRAGQFSRGHAAGNTIWCSALELVDTN